jgi:hypothetical protein
MIRRILSEGTAAEWAGDIIGAACLFGSIAIVMFFAPEISELLK